MGGAIAGCLLIMAAVYLILAIAYDTGRFVCRTYHIDTGRGLEKTTVVFISDLHNKQYGKDNCRLLEAIEEMHPDAVLLGGDMITASGDADIEPAVKLIGELSGRYPVYFGSGNHEQRLYLYPEKYGDSFDRLEASAASAGVLRLRNEKKPLGDRIVISSVETDREYYKRRNAPELTGEKMEEYLGRADGEKYNILLAHNPDHFDAYIKWGADLVLAGHVHGGIIRIPGLGGLISPKVTLFPEYDGGRFDKDGCIMIVSCGLGCHTIPVRLWNPGELIKIEIE